jgi:hypothetical protein
VKPDPKHQENDTDPGELEGEVLIGDVARRERPDHHACQEIAH